MKLKIGDTAPDFEFIDQDGNKQNFHSVKGKKIVYFFPKAFTKVCTIESCSIRDSYDDLKIKGVTEVFGISTDPSDKQDKFVHKHELPFILVEDTSKEISKNFGTLFNLIILKFSKRVTFLIDEKNLILNAKNIGIRGNNTVYGINQYGKELLELNYIEDDN